MKKLIAVILALLLAFCLVGCDNSGDKRIYFELPEIPVTLDPQTASGDSELLIVRNLFEGLLRLNSKGEIVSGVAERYEKNGNEYTFYLDKDAAWDTGEKIVADDFVFAFRRALDPATDAPNASRLMCIAGAAGVKAGADVSSLGITATDDHTLKINLQYDDPEFLTTLTTAICMPCDEEFFNSCQGKYGLDQKSIMANGSYYLAKWNQTDFGIRIYKNAEYYGDFTAKNGGVFLSKSDENSALTELTDETVDAAFLDSGDIAEAREKGYKIQSAENICWVLTVREDYSAAMRSAFAMLINRDAITADAPYGIRPADSLFPSVLNVGSSVSSLGIKEYNSENGKKLFSDAVKRTEDKKFPKTTLYYYDDPAVKPLINDMIGHWQQSLSAFINMEASDNLEALQAELSRQTLQMAVFPVTAKSGSLSEYLDILGSSSTDAAAAQQQLLSGDKIIPLFFETTSIGYGKGLENLTLDTSNGYIDFSAVVKKD